jgi:hypothetical protein
VIDDTFLFRVYTTPKKKKNTSSSTPLFQRKIKTYESSISESI